jgi:NAD(P)-dependent dehydrogenase (short-subunit alcohol dehydrogenase family)
MTEYELAEKNVLITGASSGIGWELAKAFAKQGSRVVVLARRQERLEQLAAEIEAAGTERPLILCADLSKRGAAKAAADQLLSDRGPVDVLINNAGGGVGGSTWAVADGDEARDDFEVDFWSPLALIGALVPAMRKRGDGAVVNVTSIRQVFAWPSFGQNTAATAAKALVTESLRMELRQFGVRVLEVILGPVDTPIQGPTKLIPGLVDSVHARFGVASPQQVAALVVAGVRQGAERVFCPPEVTQDAYEHPHELREQIAGEVARLQAELPLPGEEIDQLIFGSDHPVVLQARAQWEQEHAEGKEGQFQLDSSAPEE